MPENLMSSKFYTIKDINSVNVIELTLPDMLDSVEFDKLNETMLHVFDGRANEQWVLDLSQVEYVGSAVLGLMVNIRQHVKAGKGRLVLCALSKTLSEIFRASSLERLFTITKTRAEALRAV
jgi:anti-sigma B factor antagonist